MENLDKLFRGHNIPQEVVREHVLSCPNCQKNRNGMRFTLEPVVKTHHRVDGPRSIVGADLLKVEKDEEGYEYIIVFSNHYTKRVKLYKSKDKKPESFATALLRFVNDTYMFDELRTDNGSDYTSKVTEILCNWLGIKRSFTITNNPKGSNVEGTNSQVLRHLRMICEDEDVRHIWSKDHILLWVEYFINMSYNSEVGNRPLILDNGDFNEFKERLPPDFDTLTPHDKATAYVKALRDQRDAMRAVVAKHHEKLDMQRRSDTSNQAFFQPGDLVLYKPPFRLPHKLMPRLLGPYKVIAHTGNNVEMRHVATQKEKVVESIHLSRFIGSEVDAFKWARRDDEQYELIEITAYRGDPMTRTTCEFFCHFLDGTKIWKPYDADLASAEAFHDFCVSLPQLKILAMPFTIAQNHVRRSNSHIDPSMEGKTIYADLRCWSDTWYQTLDLPNKDFTTYVVKGTYGKIKQVSKSLAKIDVSFPALGENYTGKKAVNGSWVILWGSQQHLLQDQVLVDDDFVFLNPNLLHESIRERHLKDLRFQRKIQTLPSSLSAVTTLSAAFFRPSKILAKPGP
jgi:hypothetical protein